MSTKTIQSKLLAEFAKRKTAPDKTRRLSVQKLLDASGLAMDRSTLHRKLYGSLPMTVEEARAVGKVLGFDVHESTVRIVRSASVAA